MNQDEQMPEVRIPVVCGHRGMPAVAAENSLAGFGVAAANGASWIEFDVRPSGDGDLVVHHDPVTHDGLHVGTTPRAALGDYPSLREVFESYGSTLGFDIELKTDDIGIELDEFADRALAVIEECARSFDPDRLVVTSFDQQVLSAIRATGSPVATGLLFHKRSMDWAISTAVAAGHSTIAPWHPLVAEAGVQRAHDAGLRVATWTVNASGQIRSVAAAGVDMIIGDDSALIANVLAERSDSDDA